MLIRSAYMMPVDRARAGQIAGEAIDTYVYQYVYSLEAIRAAYRSFKANRPILDSRALKYDSNIRQGQLDALVTINGAKCLDKVNCWQHTKFVMPQNFL